MSLHFECQVCGAPSIRIRPTKKFCSDRCKKRAFRARDRAGLVQREVRQGREIDYSVLDRLLEKEAKR